MDKKSYDVTKYDRPSVTTDLVVFTIKNNSLNVLLVERGGWPFKGKCALPGGFVRMNESLDEAAKRELKEETGIKDVYLEQLYTFGNPKRDPRTRVITVSYLALVDWEKFNISASTDAKDVDWFDMNNLPNLAFDHNKILEYALKRLRAKLSYSNIGFTLLPELFTLSEVQRVYEIILDKPLDKRNFRRRLDNLDLVEETKHMKKDGAHRPAKLYRVKSGEFELKVFD